MSRSFTIKEILPWLVNQLPKSSDLDQAEIQSQLEELNMADDDARQVKKLYQQHKSHYVKTNSEEEQANQEITDNEFYRNKYRIDSDLKKLVARFFKNHYQILQDKNYVIFDDGNGILDKSDFIFDLDNPESWKSSAQSSQYFLELGQTAETTNPAHFIGSNLATLIYLHSQKKSASLVELSQMIANIPQKDLQKPEEEASILQTVDLILKNFDEARTTDDDFKMQDMFIQLLVLAKKGWGEKIFTPLSQVTQDQWNRIFNHPTLPLKTARAFGKALSFSGGTLKDQFTKLIQNPDLPFPFRLLISSARCYQDHFNGELPIIKATLYQALDTSPASHKTHPAYRMMALEALGYLANLGDLEADDITHLMDFIKNYQSPKEDDIKKLLSKASFDRDTRQKIMIQQGTPEEAESNLLPQVQGDYSVSGVLTYWLMDLNHQIAQKAFAVLCAIPQPEKVSTAILDFMTQPHYTEGEKSLAYVEYYKQTEALNALGILYQKNKWINIAFNNHQNNQIGREFERNADFTAMIMGSFAIDTNEIMKSWDNEESLLAQNYTALQIARYYQENSNEHIAEFATLSEAEKQKILDEPFNDSSPKDLASLEAFLRKPEIKAALLKMITDDKAYQNLKGPAFQRWQNWQHFGPFLISEKEALKQAFAADLLRKAWSWEFFQLRPEEFKDDDVAFSVLKGMKKNPFAYLRIDFLVYFLNNSNPKLQIAAIQALADMHLPREYLHSKLKPKDISHPQVRQAWNHALIVATHKKPHTQAYPSAEKKGLQYKVNFEDSYGRGNTSKRLKRKMDDIDHPKDSSPHSYIGILYQMAFRYGDETINYMIDLLEDPSTLNPANHKFRYIAERHDLISILADFFFPDPKLKKLFKGLFLHASDSSGKLLTPYLRRWNQKHQATLIELLREFHLTFKEGQDPLAHLARVGHEFVRRQYILASLRDAVDQQGKNPIVPFSEHLNEVEEKLKEKPADSEQAELLKEERRRWLDYEVDVLL